MGTLSTTKPLKNVSGTITEFSALTTSAGAADAQAIPALNNVGVLDLSIINGTVTSAGAASAAKVVALDGAGKIDQTLMPVGFGDDAIVMTTSEALSAGNFVNVWNSTGAKVRKADATVSGKQAHGFVLSAAASGATVTVYFEGTNTAVTGQIPGDVFLSTTAGLSASAPPTGAGNVAQSIGVAVSATAINFQYQKPIVLI